jgi:hypothetical protein
MSLNTKTSDRSYGHSHQQLRKAWAVGVAPGPGRLRTLPPR